MKKLLVTATLLSSEHEAREKGRGGEGGGNKLRSKPSLVVQIGPERVPESPEDTFFGEN